MTPEDRTKLPQPLPPSTSATDSRRRLLRGGLAVTPALLTLTSRPVMAQVGCFTPSMGLSANLSRGGSGIACDGLSASYWGSESSFPNWPVPMALPGAQKDRTQSASEGELGSVTAVSGKASAAADPSTHNGSTVARESGETKPAASKGTTFDSVFGPHGGYRGKTLVDILSMNTNSGRDGLARHLTAAYLNILKGLIPSTILDVPTVKNIWASYVARGYYEPTAGIRWFPDHAEPANKLGGIIAWLKTTMPR